MSGPNHPRGTSNSNKRGSSADRRLRRQYLLDRFGNGEFVACFRQISPKCSYVLDVDDVTVDRIVAGTFEGTYRRSNIIPSCGPCNSAHGNLIRDGKPSYEARIRDLLSGFIGAVAQPR